MRITIPANICIDIKDIAGLFDDVLYTTSNEGASRLQVATDQVTGTLPSTSEYDVNFVNGKWVNDRSGKLKELKDKINDEKNKLCVVTYGDNRYQTDEISINIMNESSLLVGSFFWSDADNKKVLIKNKDLENIIKIKVDSMQGLIEKQLEIEEEISKLTDEEVINFEIKIGE